MSQPFFIEEHSVHLWQVVVPELVPQIERFSQVLNAEEKERANRFRFMQHRQRYQVTRAVLRNILQLYTQIPAQELAFTLGKRGKPYLKENRLKLQFNVSHSHDMAVYAFTRAAEIGVDVEKIRPDFDEGVAQRFFSPEEYSAWSGLSREQQLSAFYYLWSGKEAIIKALGEGLYAPLTDFSLVLHKESQMVALTHQQQIHHYHLEYFAAHAEYQAVFATAQIVKNIHRWQWTEAGPIYLSQP